jgi:hypothetical protein
MHNSSAANNTETRIKTKHDGANITPFWHQKLRLLFLRLGPTLAFILPERDA